MPVVGHRHRRRRECGVAAGRRADPCERIACRKTHHRAGRRRGHALAEWHQRVRSGARRRHRSRRGDPAQRGAGGRQVDPAARGGIPGCRPRYARAVRVCGRVGAAGAHARPAHGGTAAEPVPRGRSRPWGHPRPDRTGRPAARHRRLRADRCVLGVGGPGRRAGAGARGGIHTDSRRQRPQRARASRRSRHQRRHHRRAATARTPGGCGAPVRGRPPDLPAVRSLPQKPVRPDRRGWLFRDDRRRHRRGRRPERAVPLPRAHAGERHLRHDRHRGPPRATGRGAGSHRGLQRTATAAGGQRRRRVARCDAACGS